MKIAVGHKSRVGKDTFADHLKTLEPDIVRVQIAEPVYLIVNYIQDVIYPGVAHAKNPALLQAIGETVRGVCGPDTWINPALEKIKRIPAGKSIIVTDMRQKNEMWALKAAGFVTVKIVRDNRPIDRDPNHPSEVDLDNEEFDYVVYNNSSIADYYEAIEHVIKKIRENKIFA